MDDTEDDAGYPPKPHHHRHHSSHHHKLPARSVPAHAGHRRRYPEDELPDEDVEGSVEEEERDQNEMEQSVDGEDEDKGGDGEEEEEEEEEEQEVGVAGGSAYRRAGAEPFKRRRKRRRLDRLALGFEFAPRVAAQPPPPSAPSRPPPPPPPRSSPAADWSEDSTFLLLDAWGDLYIQNGRKSLRSDEWMEVAKKVSQSSRTARSEVQCRNRLDTLKKKYKKEKSRMAESASNLTSKWIYFTKMDSLMVSPPTAAARQVPRLPCGFDSGEYVFMNSRVYVNRSNDLDEMRDSPGDSECEDEAEGDDSDGLPPERAKAKGNSDSSSSFRMLADSIQKFGEIYEKIENSKRQHMAELERMRKEFHRDLEVQKRQILERAQSEIAKIRQGAGEDDEDDDGEEREDEDINNEDEEIDVSLDDGSS